jgi:hypothetical protein
MIVCVCVCVCFKSEFICATTAEREVRLAKARHFSSPSEVHLSLQQEQLCVELRQFVASVMQSRPADHQITSETFSLGTDGSCYKDTLCLTFEQTHINRNKTSINFVSSTECLEAKKQINTWPLRSGSLCTKPCKYITEDKAEKVVNLVITKLFGDTVVKCR